jgi:hypothetical protein
VTEIYCFPCVEQVPVAHSNNDDDDGDGDNIIIIIIITNLCNIHFEHKKWLSECYFFQIFKGKKLKVIFGILSILLN